MKVFPFAHPWNVSPRDAMAIQNRLRAYLSLHWDDPPVSRVGGIDCSYAMRGGDGYAVVMVMGWPDLEEIDTACARGTISFPWPKGHLRYIPGLLTFREAPLVLEAWERLRHWLKSHLRLPDLIF
jgi:deoxyribonuclease V